MTVKPDMVLIYDIRHDRHVQKDVLTGLEDQWRLYLRGQLPVNIKEGRISELFYAPYEGEHMFRLGEKGKGTAWIQQGDVSWYGVGRRAKVESVTFNAPPPIGAMPVVTRIWVGTED